ncbi:MAG: hypothetical protein E4G94_01695 [ANME-2 cluster archaeon]|jgi:hypothetical protein|nr:MAG: hypothetical protein E4G94_01695 [ANME-2 cluster archaeon]
MKKMNILSIILILSSCLVTATPYLGTTYELSASWRKGYDSTEALLEDTAIVVVCEVDSSVSYAERPEDEGSLYYTTYSLTIVDLLYGDESSESITMVQTGGIVGLKKKVIEDFPLLKKNKTYVLFLKQAEDGTYSHVGGPQGQFLLKNKKVYSIGELDSKAELITVGLHEGGVSLEDFL